MSKHNTVIFKGLAVEINGHYAVLSIPAFEGLLEKDFQKLKSQCVKSEKSMDKQIKKAKRVLDKNMDKLVKADKPRDKKLKKCNKVMKSKAKSK